MHKKWEDMMAVYVTGALPPAQVAALEQHLAGCEPCRRSLAEWRAVAQVSREQAGEWARSAPPLSSTVRAHAALQPGHPANGHRPAFDPDQTVRSAPLRWSARGATRGFRLPVTLAASLLVVILVGVMLLVLSGRDDSQSGTTGAGLGSPYASVAPLLSSASPTITATPVPISSSVPVITATPFVVNAGEADWDLGILPSGTATIVPFGGAQAYASPTFVTFVPTPTAIYGQSIGGSYVLLTTETVGAIPADTRVRISHAWFDGVDWVYVIVARDSASTADVRASQLTYVPGAPIDETPTAVYGRYGGSGYVLLTTDAVGEIPAGAPVRISHAWFDGDDWIYVVVAQDETTIAEARASQLTFRPGAPTGATPTPVYQRQIGGGYSLFTTTDIESIPAYTRVRISHGWFDGLDWVYTIVAQDGTTADARASQLTYAQTAPNPTPTAALGTYVGTGYTMWTVAPVGAIPAGTQVRIDYSRFDGAIWWYGIVAPDGRTAEARTSQIVYAPTGPTSTPVTAGGNTYAGEKTGVAFDYPMYWYLEGESIGLAYAVTLTSYDPATGPPPMAAWTPDTVEMQIIYAPASPEDFDTWIASEKEQLTAGGLEFLDESDMPLPHGNTGTRLDFVSGSGHGITRIYSQFDGRPIIIHIVGGVDLALDVINTFRPVD